MASRNIYEQTFDEDVQQNDHNTCPECDGRVTSNTHETVCDGCGLVIDDQQVDRGPEWHSYDSEDRKRVGAPNTVSRHDDGIGTEIGSYRDSRGRKLSKKKRRQLGRLRREHTRAQTGSKFEQNRITGLTEIRRMTSALGLGTSTRDQTCQLFRTAQDETLLQGRSIEAIASACLYAVCRINEQPRSFEEIATVSKVSDDRIRTGYTALNRGLSLPVPPAGPKQYLPQIASSVGAGQRTERQARELIEQAPDTELRNGKNPLGAAAGALYLASQQTGEYLNQQKVADAADVSDATVRERYRDLEAVTVS